MVAVPVRGGYPGRTHARTSAHDAALVPSGATRVLPLLRAQLTPATVKQYLAHMVEGEVDRFEVPGIHALNFLPHQALGGGMASLPVDPLARGYAQMLLDFPVAVPEEWVHLYALGYAANQTLRPPARGRRAPERPAAGALE